MSTVPCEGLHREIPYSEVERQRIRAHLDELLRSEAFAGSRRRQEFLRYVVEETLAGRGSTIKEANIATDVFGRGPEFDVHGGSVVRVTGGEVRKRLAQAYSSGLGQDLRIELPLGGYHPTFYFSSPSVDAPAADPGPLATTAPNQGRFRNVWMAAVVGILLVAGLSVPMLGRFRASAPLDQLWQPFLVKDRPVLISIAAPTLLMLDPRNQSKYLPLDAGKAIPSSEFVVLKDSFVGTGGAMGAARFAERLTQHGQKFDLKFGSDVTFSDLKNSPTLLIGVSALTQRLTQNARFEMQMSAEGIKIVDSKNKGKEWGRPKRSFASPPRADGYTLITRLIRSEFGHPVLMVAGMDSHNTEAAIEFLTQNDVFRRFAQSAPADWSSKNFQVVLHNTIYGNSAGSLSVVASEVW